MSINNERLLKGLQNPYKASYYVITRLLGKFYKFIYSRRRHGIFYVSNFRVMNKLGISGPGSIAFYNDILVDGGPFKINTFYTFTEDVLIKVGSHTYCNGVRIFCINRVDIGIWCMYADARITNNDAHSVYPNRSDPKAPIQSKPVIIEYYVWACLAAIILKGIRIGGNSVKAAGAVVSNDVPENCVVAGNPARVVKNFSFEEIEIGKQFFIDKHL